jgi:hypothetical protein
VAKSSVAISSELEAGVPQAEQKRPVAGTSVPQDEQAGMNFPDTVYRVRNKNVSGNAGRTLRCITIPTMSPLLRRWLADPLVLLCLAAGLLAFVVQSGELGTADTMHRLQTTHWLWTSEPQVFPNEYPEFGLHGRGGRLYSWYGIGQSLLMLPADLAGTWIAHWQVFSDYGDDPAVRSIVVSYGTGILVNVLTALVGFRLLCQLRFSVRESVLGVLALMLCTTHLHYTQNMMENNYIMLLTLTGLSFQYAWLRTGSTRALLFGCAALGLNLLTRLTTGLDLVAGSVFLFLVLWFEQVRGRELWRRFVAYCKVAAPVYAFFLLVDRLYQFYRFGSFTNTYVSLFAKEQRLQDPTLPPNFPWSTPFHEGFLGALFKPEKSIFLFDPLLVLAIVLLAILWERLSPEIRAYCVASLFLLLAYISFYARYTYWAGDFAWGDRYVSTSVELAALLAVPLLLRYRENVSAWIWRGGNALIVGSLIIQLVSLAFWLPLEIYQMETLGHPTFVIALRCKNIVAFALGKMDAWGLDTEAMHWDAWDYVHITTWNFLPFLLRRVGAAPGWVVKMAFAVWGAGIAALLLACKRLLRVVEW